MDMLVSGSDRHNPGLQAREQMKVGGMKTKEGVFDGLRMLARSRLFVKLTVCVMLSGIVMEGMYELLGQYFQLKLGYNTADQASLVNLLHTPRLPVSIPGLHRLFMVCRVWCSPHINRCSSHEHHIAETPLTVLGLWDLCLVRHLAVFTQC